MNCIREFPRAGIDLVSGWQCGRRAGAAAINKVLLFLKNTGGRDRD